MRFPKTSWTLLEAACADGERGESALRDFSRQYYGPVRAFLSVICRKDEEELLELAHSFFDSKILSRTLLLNARRGQGQFRHYLKQALRNHVADYHRALQRRDRREVSMDSGDSGAALVSDNPWREAEVAYNREYVRTLLERALAEVRSVCMERGLDTHLQIFLMRYRSESVRVPEWGQIGRHFGLDQKAARHRAETVVRHFRDAVRRILIEETGSEEAADEEIATLLALL